MLENVIQHYWKLVVVPWLGGRVHFAKVGKVLIKSFELADLNQQVMCM